MNLQRLYLLVLMASSLMLAWCNAKVPSSYLSRDKSHHRKLSKTEVSKYSTSPTKIDRKRKRGRNSAVDGVYVSEKRNKRDANRVKGKTRGYDTSSSSRKKKQMGAILPKRKEPMVSKVFRKWKMIQEKSKVALGQATTSGSQVCRCATVKLKYTSYSPLGRTPQQDFFLFTSIFLFSFQTILFSFPTS